MNKMPSKSQANTYAAVTNYLKALDAAKSDDAATVMRQMKSTKADYFGKPVSIRQNGRVAYDLTVYEVKSPAESKYPWDYYKPVRKVSADEAFGPDNAGECTVK
jgi:branched-chain amino acid transport system substrate-binding protein